MTSSSSTAPDMEQVVREWSMAQAEFKVLLVGVCPGEDGMQDIRDVARQFIRADWEPLVLQDLHLMCDMENRIHYRRYCQAIRMAVASTEFALVYNREFIHLAVTMMVSGMLADIPKVSFGDSFGHLQPLFSGHMPTHGALQEMLDRYSRLAHLGSRHTRLQAALAQFQV